MYHICIAQGLANCTPDSQDYHACGTQRKLCKVVAAACREFDREEIEGQEAERPYSYPFNPPRQGENNWSQRLRIAKGHDYVLDVIGMTAEEYEREQGE